MLPWPEFWNHIPDADRQPLRESVVDLLKTGAILGDEGAGRELFLLARDQYFSELSAWFAVLNIELVFDAERPILQARPAPGECELVATFSKEETLIVLSLWRIWDEAMTEKPTAVVVLTTNDLWLKLQLFFDKIEPPTWSSLERILAKLRRKRLIHYQRSEDANRMGDGLVEILPTLPRAIPFQDLEAWEAQAALYRGEAQR
jgi:Domain of unknown function (DUF4194)